MSTQPLTEVEAAAARAIGGDFECTWHVGCDEECNADRARAVVAAVRGPLYREAADLIANSERLRSFTDDHMGDIEEAAEALREAARPTSEEH